MWLIQKILQFKILYSGRKIIRNAEDIKVQSAEICIIFNGLLFLLIIGIHKEIPQELNHHNGAPPTSIPAYTFLQKPSKTCSVLSGSSSTN